MMKQNVCMTLFSWKSFADPRQANDEVHTQAKLFTFRFIEIEVIESLCRGEEGTERNLKV